MSPRPRLLGAAALAATLSDCGAASPVRPHAAAIRTRAAA